jgi:hypothetical protein
MQERMIIKKFRDRLLVVKLTPLGNDGAGGNDDNGPVELLFKVRDNLVADLAESGEAAEGDANEQSLGGRAVSLLVFNQISAVDEDLGKA